MLGLEQLELEAHRNRLDGDVRRLVDKYLAIAEWDVPEIDEPLSIRLIIEAIRRALDGVEHELMETPNFQPLGRHP